MKPLTLIRLLIFATLFLGSKPIAGLAEESCGTINDAPDCSAIQTQGCILVTQTVTCNIGQRTHNVCGTTWVAPIKAYSQDKIKKEKVSRKAKLLDDYCGYANTGSCAQGSTGSCTLGVQLRIDIPHVPDGQVNIPAGESFSYTTACLSYGGADPQLVGGGKVGFDWATSDAACCP